MLHLAVRAYCRPFRQPLQTAHGLWEQREGLILRFENEQGQVSFGEIAPIPGFGTETLAAAAALCDRFPRHFSLEQIVDIPDSLPACQFGFGAASSHLKSLSQAWERDLSFENLGHDPRDMCALLPTGAAALDGWQGLWERGHRTFKWKIGVAPIEQELALFQQLVEAVPPELRLRLDANGGLTAEAAESWLSGCDRGGPVVEFLEQPLPPDRILDWLPPTLDRFGTAIALDESIATLKQLQQVYQQVGNRVVYGIKPAIAGFPTDLLAICRQYQLDVVVSSALETSVGRTAVLELAHQLRVTGLTRRAWGVGVGHWFADDWDSLRGAELWTRL